MLGSLSRRTSACISDLTFDEWLAEELSATHVAELEAHLLECTRCETRRRALESGHAAFLGAHPRLALKPPASSASVSQRPSSLMSGKLRRVPNRMAGGLAACLAAAACVFLLYLPREPQSERAKGKPHLGFFLKRGDHVTRGSSGQLLRAGDSLRFFYTSDRDAYLAVLSLAESGQASVYYPASSLAAPAPRGRDVALPSAVELDASVGHERVVAVFCTQVFAVPTLVEAMSHPGAALAAPAGCTLDVLQIEKGP